MYCGRVTFSWVSPKLSSVCIQSDAPSDIKPRVSSVLHFGTASSFLRRRISLLINLEVLPRVFLAFSAISQSSQSRYQNVLDMASTVILVTGKSDKTARVPSAIDCYNIGSNSGVGFATAKVIASTSEAFHVLVAGRSLEKAEAAVSEIKAAGVKGLLSAVQLDVTDDNSIEKAATFVNQNFGKLDVLVNNAAVANGDPDIKVRLRKCMETNVVGPAAVSAAFRSLLLKSQNPYSIYISSATGSLALASDPNSPPQIYRGPPRGEAYRASKAALNMLVLQELVELGGAPLKIFAVCPGFVRSNLAGTGEVGRIRNSKAGDPDDSARLILGVIQGKRDEDVGRFIHQSGVHPW